MKRYNGTKASMGIALGPVYSIKKEITSMGRVVKDPEKERELFDAAVVIAKEELRALQEKAVEEDKDIFVFQQALLDDCALQDEVYGYIMAGAGSAAAVERAAGYFTETLQSVSDEYIRLRSADVQDACRRVVDILDGRPRGSLHLTRPSILVAEQVMPSEILSLDRGMLLGIAASCGSVHSHAAIIARTMGIPAVVGLGREFLSSCTSGTTLLMYADEGTVLVDPDSESCKRARELCHRQQEERSRLSGLLELPCRIGDGTEVTLMANCSGPEDISDSIQNGAQGVGLLRSEFLVIDNGDFPGEQEQYYFYTSCIAAAQGRVVTIRTFDLGADKLSADMVNKEINPALGLRGIRFCLSRREAFLVQLCALLRAGACGPLRVMFPMISSVEDWTRAMECVGEAKSFLEQRGVEYDPDLVFGCMVEVPSAALLAAELAQAGCGFFSIGTNDLVQYTLAVDRIAPQVAAYYQPQSPAVYKLIDMTVQAGREYGIPVCVCGLSASDPVEAQRLVRHGIRCLSMEAQSLLPIKSTLMEMEQCSPPQPLGKADIL